ncbi:Rpn family recombination-promoting nuclease/putative transposase [Tunicatimonas pelagia]|uniref:Rpn family recombination-promoting nuclease/putative transposase n=1 Tax=Tunicatimonas pelagia TaxID=931531 RepID=UPI002666560E|nr:Rpn family recombination-promoting nuclease/putative transposase [Tunicatimonas pelagia]WKN46194.1 Rpn family recombination-promoting nuclease/putative transposase [Tunicatimonas pelagia]
MEEPREKYINPFTDYGFKRLFGEEPNNDLLLDFLNELLKEEQGRITELTYLKSDKLGSSEDDRKAVFDLYCENERGEKFIVELQKTKQKFFKDRTVYYSTFPIREQAQRGSDWTFELNAVYTIAILDFIFDEDKSEPDKFRYDVKLTDIDTFQVFYDKLTFVYLEMPKFSKTTAELKTRFDKWMYVIRNLNKLDRIPDELRESIFERLFEVAEIAKFSPQEVQAYEDSLKSYRDLKNSLNTAFEEGKKEGIEKGIEQGIEKGIEQGIEKVAIGLLNQHVSDEIILSTTGLTKIELQALKEKYENRR